MADLEFSAIVRDQISKPSPIRQIMKMADRQNILNMGLDPDDVISFGGGWVNHPAPDGMRHAYKEIAESEKDFHRSGGYSPTLGEPFMRDSLANFEREIFGMVNISRENIIVGQSSTQITHDLFVSVLESDDSVLFLDPSYANYPGQVEFVAWHSRMLKLPVLDTEDWLYLPDPSEALERFKELYSREHPAVVLVPSPDNPTSQIPPDEFVKGLQEVTMDGGSYLVLDFAYKVQCFGEAPGYFSWSPEDHPNLVSLHSNSKWCRGLGRRLGWMEASREMIDAMERVQQCSILCPDTLHQMAISRYLDKAMEDGSLRGYLDHWRSKYAEAAKVTVKAIDEHLDLPRLEPQGGLYTCMDVGRDSNGFVPEVLKNTGVLFIPGPGFGDTLKDAVRISYGPMVNDLARIEEGMERVGEYLGKC